MGRDDVVYGVHPVLELLEREPARVERVLVSLGRHAGLARLLRRAREVGVPVSHLAPEALARRAGRRAVHQGLAALVAPFAYADVDALCRAAAPRPDARLVVADRIVDPRNLGAILRTAAAAGVDGVILSADGSAGVTAGVAKSSAGTLGRVPVAREARPAARVLGLREAGFRAVALDPRARLTWDRVDLAGRLVFVAGGEERGARPGLLRACDRRVSIPLGGGVESLNVAVALGVLLFEAVRQRRVQAGGLETPSPA